jgi:hypothetical protein
MIHDNLSHLIAPPSGGLIKLRAGIAREEKAEREEKLIMNIVLSCLFVAFSFFGLKDLDFGPPTFRDSNLIAKNDLQIPGVVAESAPADKSPTPEITRLAGTPANVQIYLITKQ